MPRPSPALLNFSGDFIEVQYAGSCLARAQGCRVPIRIALVPCCPIAVKPRQSSRHIGSNRRPNGRLWATLPLGLTRGNGSRLLEPPTTACTGGPSFVDACMRTGVRKVTAVGAISLVHRTPCAASTLSTGVPHSLIVAEELLTCSVAEDLAGIRRVVCTAACMTL